MQTAYKVKSKYRSKFRQLDNYLLLDQIGKGGTADIFLAYDKKNKRQVAVKVLHADKNS